MVQSRVCHSHGHTFCDHDINQATLRAKSLDFTMPISESTMAYVKRKGDTSINSGTS